MRIAHCIRALFAVLGMAAAIQTDLVNKPHEQRHCKHPPMRYNSSIPLMSAEKPRKLLREEAKKFGDVECCPAVMEMIEPMAGEAHDGRFVELFQNAETPQRFYESSCHPDIVNKPCRFVDKRFLNNSHCVQKYSYAYAIVKDDGSKNVNFPTFMNKRSGPDGHSFTLDYIKVRSGCTCVMKPKRKPPVCS